MVDEVNGELKIKIISGLFWRIMERGGTQGIQLIVSIMLARLLMPKDFGMIGLITVFIAIANVFVQSGFGSALVQKKEVNEQDYSSVFYLCLFISLVFYSLLFFAAPLIASFYAEPLLSSVLRVLALSLFLGAINTIQNAVISREMRFKKSFFVSIGGIIASGAVGIYLAYSGYGVWSLVYSSLAGQLVSTIILGYVVRWKPRLIFSLKRLGRLFDYGSKLLFSALLDTTFNNLYTLIIGKLFSQTTLGYYNRAQSMPTFVANNLDGAISSVMFPALSSYQSDRCRLKGLMRRMMITSAFLIIPLMFGLAVVSQPVVIILLTEKWLPSVPFMQLLCLQCAFLPVHTANLQAIMAGGRSDIFFKLEIIKKILFLAVIGLTFTFGVYAMVAGSVILSLVSMVINSWPNKQLLDYPFREQCRDLLPIVLLSAAMSGLVMLVSLLQMKIGWELLLQIIIGGIFYFAGAYLGKFECLSYLINTLRKISEKPLVKS